MNLPDDESYLADMPDFINIWIDGKAQSISIAECKPFVLKAIRRAKRDALKAAARLADKIARDNFGLTITEIEADPERTNVGKRIRALMPKEES